MKKAMNLFVFAAVLFAANAAIAGTSFVSASINLLEHDSNGTPTGYEYSKTFTTKYTTSCSTLDTRTAGCSKYQMYTAWIATGYAYNLRADYTQAVIQKSETTPYNDTNWDTLHMSDDFPSTSRSWGNSGYSYAYNSGTYRKYVYNTNYSDDRHLLLDDYDRPEVRIQYQYSDGDDYWGREFDFGISYLE